MKERLKVLVIEDSNDDAILLIRRLRKSGYEPEWSRVETRGEMETALEERAWDLIISDHSMPGFNAGMALRVLKKRDLDVPLVILSGTIDEKEAVEAMKAGACDFIKKGDSARLMPAIEREVRQLKARRAARRVELELRAAQRMEAIGRLAGGVAHDFNNLLSIILGACSFLLAEVPESDSEKRQDLEDIRDAGERAASLTRQLLAFSRKQIFKTEALDINAVVSNMARMLKRLINESVRMEIKLADGLKPVLGDRGQLEQVLVNLVVNARDAMSRGGSLTLSTQERMLAGGGGRAFEFKPDRKSTRLNSSHT